MRNKAVTLAFIVLLALPYSVNGQVSEQTYSQDGRAQNGYYAAQQPRYATPPASSSGANSYAADRALAYQGHRKTVIEEMRNSLNPCNRNYSMVLDGWQDDALQLSIENKIWWAAIILFCLCVALGFDDYFRKKREDDVREAFISSSLVLMNDRNMLVEKYGEAADRHNKLVRENDELRREVDGKSVSQAAQSVVAAFQSPAISGATHSVSEPLADILGDANVPSEGSAQARYTSENAAPIVDAQLSGAIANTDQGDHVPYNLGGKVYMIPPEVERHIKEQKRKIDNLSSRNRLQEEKLRKYGEL